MWPDKLAIWDAVRNRSQSSRCVSLSSFSGSLSTTVIVLKCTNRTNTLKRSSVVMHGVWLYVKSVTQLHYISNIFTRQTIRCVEILTMVMLPWCTHMHLRCQCFRLSDFNAPRLRCGFLCVKREKWFSNANFFLGKCPMPSCFSNQHISWSKIFMMDYLRVSEWIQDVNMQSLIADYHHKCS